MICLSAIASSPTSLLNTYDSCGQARKQAAGVHVPCCARRVTSIHIRRCSPA
jgi:hypothetical protein